jgi:outer membrane protein assembly factor BamB
MQTGRSIAVIAVVLALGLPAAGQEIMYGSTGFGTPRGAFGTVDQTNANFTLIGDPTSGSSQNLVGISFDSTGRLFGVVVGGESGGSALIEINPSNGSLISAIGAVHDSEDNVRIVDLATQPGSDTLFGIDDSGQLWTIDKGTAVATLIGSTGIDRGGIAFGPDGTLYLASVNSQLARLDPATGLVIGTPIDLSDCFDGLAVRPSDDALFGTACDSNDIYRINAATGDLTLLGSPDNDTADLAFKIAPPGLPVPAPALSPAALAALAACLATAGVVLLARRRRSPPRSLVARG